jgi:multicomponent Na+:H+ antiporter subunit D
MENINIVPLFVIVPLAGAFLTSLFGRFVKRSADVIAVITTSLLLGFSIYGRFLLNSIPDKIMVYKVGGWLPPFGILMVLDGLSSFMLVTVNLITFFVAVYSLG